LAERKRAAMKNCAGASFLWDAGRAAARRRRPERRPVAGTLRSRGGARRGGARRLRKPRARERPGRHLLRRQLLDRERRQPHRGSIADSAHGQMVIAEGIASAIEQFL